MNFIREEFTVLGREVTNLRKEWETEELIEKNPKQKESIEGIAVVVAQLAERSLPIAEVRGLNLVISKIL